MQPWLEKLEPAKLDGSAESAKDPAQRAVLGRVDRAGCCPKGVRGLIGQRLPSQAHRRTLRLQGRGQAGIKCPVDTQAPGPLWEKGLWPRRCGAGAAHGPVSPHLWGPGNANQG